VQATRKKSELEEAEEVMKDNNCLQKICQCKDWSKCPHGWHFVYQFDKKGWRFSLDKDWLRAGIEPPEGKVATVIEAKRIKIAIEKGTFNVDARKPKADMTVRQLADEYLDRYVKTKYAVDRAHSAHPNRPSAREGVFASALKVICRTEITHLTRGMPLALGEWPVADVVKDSLERFREVRGRGVGTNRYLGYLRALWAWGLGAGHVSSTPFKRNGEVVVKLDKKLEQPRSRRLGDGEEAKLLAVADVHLRALIIAALETGMRKGEILSLQWEQVEGMEIDEKSKVAWGPRVRLFLPKTKTKTKEDRRIPISMRLRGVLEMRRFDPKGSALSSDAYVFGTEVGTRVLGFKRAWQTAVLKAHGYKPTFTDTANFSPESRAALAKINLHFHDLRREAGSRWLENRVLLHEVKEWLGHSNISQTNTYLSATTATHDDAMARFEASRNFLESLAKKPGRKGPRKTVRGGRKPNKTGVGRDATIN
jgi:integrase